MRSITGIFKRLGNSFSAPSLFESIKNSINRYENKARKLILSPIAFSHLPVSLFLDDEKNQLPLYDIPAELIITADARLDNRSELSDLLNLSKGEFNDINNAQLILLAWQKWGSDCPIHLIGDYAFAIWDIKQKLIFCARDHIGARPFYYSLTFERFTFASDIEGVMSFPETSNELDEEYVKSFLDKAAYFEDRTFFKAVCVLPPGHSLTVTQDSEKMQKYWFPENEPKVRYSKDSDYVEAAREIYVQAISDRIQTTKNIGVHLTGGLDSSSIAVLVARERRRRNLSAPFAYSWQPLPTVASKSELEYSLIESVCRQENLIAQYCPVSAEDVLSVLKKDIAFEPTTGTIPLELPVQRRAAQDNVRLIVSGWGGDDSLSFNGRGYYANLFLRGHWWRLFRESRNLNYPTKSIAALLFLLCFSDRMKGLKILNARSLCIKESNKSFLHPKFKQNIKFRSSVSRETSVRSTLLWLWSQGTHAERMNSWTAYGRSSGITYVYPLLDRRLMEFVIGLPPEQFVRGKWNRWIMRKVAEPFLPEEVCWNLNKDEPFRVENSMAAISRAFDMARDEIMKSDSLPARSEYLDMKLLMEYLQPDVFPKTEDKGAFGRPRQMEIRRSLQFLKF